MNQCLPLYYNLHQFITIDENSCPHKGRSLGLCFNKDKPHNFFYKFYVLADALTFYPNQISPYRGARAEKPIMEREGSASTLWAQAYLTRLPKFTNKGFVLFRDNWFSQMKDVKLLKARGIYSIGTLKNNKMNTIHKRLVWGPKSKQVRGEVNCVKLHIKKVQLGSETFLPFDVWVAQMMDKNLFNIVSTIKPEEGTEDRNTTDKKTGVYAKRTYKFPQILILYKKYMGGVDHLDQLMSYYKNTHRSKDPHYTIWKHLMDMLTVAAYIL